MPARKPRRMKRITGKAPEISPAKIRILEKYISERYKSRPWRVLQMHALLHLGLGSGMRISELCALTLRDVLLSRDPIIVNDQLTLTKHITKNRKSRIVDITEQAQDFLYSWVHYMITEKKWPDTQWLFFTRCNYQKPLYSSIACYLFNSWGKKCNIGRIATHSMRRTHANQLRRTGSDLCIIQSQLGHSTLDMTRIYIDVDPIEKQEKVKRVRF